MKVSSFNLGSLNCLQYTSPYFSFLEYPGYCFDSELNQPYKNGTINQRPGKCEIARCLKDLSIQIRGCDDPMGPIFCHKIPANYTLPYPHCCPKIACV